MLWKQLNPGYRKLMRRGSQGQAVVVDAKADVSRSDKFGTFGWTVTIRVKFADGTSTDFERYVEATVANEMASGMVVPIRFDPEKPSRVEIDTAALRAEQEAMQSRQVAQAEAARDAAVQRAERGIKPIPSEPPPG
jgi:hypothetical protein